jgi:hypothetical protein
MSFNYLLHKAKKFSDSIKFIKKKIMTEFNAFHLVFILKFSNKYSCNASIFILFFYIKKALQFCIKREKGTSA